MRQNKTNQEHSAHSGSTNTQVLSAELFEAEVTGPDAERVKRRRRNQTEWVGLSMGSDEEPRRVPGNRVWRGGTVG